MVTSADSKKAEGETMDDLQQKYKPFTRTDKYGPTGVDGPPFTITEKIRIVTRLTTFVLLVGTYGIFLALIAALLPFQTASSILKSVTPPVVQVILYFLGFSDPIRVNGEKPDPRARVLVSNHVSYVDILVLGVAFYPSFVSKEAVRRAPVVGKLAELMGCIFIPEGGRTGSGSGKSSEVISRIRLAAEGRKVSRGGGGGGASHQSQPVLVFPEGTTTNGTHILEFRTGAFAAGLPVQPILLQYGPNLKVFNPSYDTISFKTHLVKLAAQPVNTCTITLLPSILPPKELKESIDAGEDGAKSETHRVAVRKFADEARNEIATAGKLELSNLSFHDKKQYHEILRERGYAM